MKTQTTDSLSHQNNRRVEQKEEQEYLMTLQCKQSSLQNYPNQLRWLHRGLTKYCIIKTNLVSA